MMQRFHTPLLIGCFTAMTVMTIVSPSSAGLFDSPVDRLPATERVTLRKGQPLVVGEEGKYTARVLMNTSPEVAWTVLTDYGNLSKFMPSVESSQVLKANGNQKVIEQVDARRVFLMNVKSRIRSEVTETAKKRIDFRLIDGDLKSMRGYWMIEPVSPYSGAKANQVLITYFVEAQPKPGTPQGIFNGIFKNSLTEMMSAIAREAGRRTR